MLKDQRISMSFAPERHWVANLAWRETGKHATTTGLIREESPWTHQVTVRASASGRRLMHEFGALVRATAVFERMAEEYHGITDPGQKRGFAEDYLRRWAPGFFERRQRLPEGAENY